MRKFFYPCRSILALGFNSRRIIHLQGDAILRLSMQQKYHQVLVVGKHFTTTSASKEIVSPFRERIIQSLHNYIGSRRILNEWQASVNLTRQDNNLLLKITDRFKYFQRQYHLLAFDIAASSWNRAAWYPCVLSKNFVGNTSYSINDFLLGKRKYFTRSLLAGRTNWHSLEFKRMKRTAPSSPSTPTQMSPNDGRKEEEEEDSSANNKYEPREISFKTPYGHIACLEWGQREAPNKILCAHGWLDNAGSFEPLIPLILKHQNNYSKYHVVAMDMPGVGHSSHRPPGSEYTVFSHIIEMRRVTQQLGWNQNLTLLAHSMGGHLSFIYSSIYPKQVSSMISIDTTHPLTHHAANWHVTIGNSIEHYFKSEYYGQKNEKLDTVMPVYTEEAAIKRLMEAHGNSLTLESARVMLKRGATKHPNGSCTFNRDVRHRYTSVEFRPDDELMLKYLDHTFKPNNLLIIRALRSPYHRPNEIRLRYYDLFERNCKLFRDVMLDGTHHLHMNTPNYVAIEINKFLDDAELARTEANEVCGGGTTKRPLVNKPNL